MNSDPRTTASDGVYIPSNLHPNQTHVINEVDTTKIDSPNLPAKAFMPEDKKDSTLTTTIVVNSSEKNKNKEKIEIENVELGISTKSESSGKKDGEQAGVDFEPINIPKPLKILLICGLSLIILLCCLDNTITTTIMTKIGTEFDNLSNVTWIITSYILAFNAVIPLAGKFTDIFGRRAVILTGVILFLAGSALSGASQSMDMLIIVRVIQGIGAGISFSCIMIIFADISTLDERAMYQGLVGAIYSIMSVLGPLIGGAFADHISWRWGFYINLPVGAPSLLLLLFTTLKLPGVQGSLCDKLKRVDYIGTVLLVGTVIAALLAVTWGGTKYDWSDARIICLFIVAGILLVMLVVYETKFAIEPTIPPHLFKIRTALAVYVGSAFFCMPFFSLLFFLPLFWQLAKHSSATTSGLRLIPIPVGLVISSTIAAILAPKFGRVRELLVIGSALSAAAIGLVSTFAENDSTGKEIAYLLIFGLGLGIIWSLGVVAVQSATDARDLASATALVNFFQLLGGVIGVSVASNVLFNNLEKSLKNIFSSPDDIFLAKNSISYVLNLPRDKEAQVIHAYVLALQQVFDVQTVLAGISVFAMLFVKNSPLRRDEIVSNDEKK
ncbi:11091_t:CDS:2 [Ambispora leptoticha]|uniref:11091_t:CDS:1 n=1 Tax=Ambispora leptoticha TaxID=144679 RepID=A0A9N8ZYP6_9GLOM|nr:11091_t:CDS:2 [Ambispora leptoticha]